MTTDERLDQVIAAIERLEARQTAAAAMQEKTDILMVRALDSILRLERIAVSHEMRLQDVEAVLLRLEERQPRKPQ